MRQVDSAGNVSYGSMGVSPLLSGDTIYQTGTNDLTPERIPYHKESNFIKLNILRALALLQLDMLQKGYPVKGWTREQHDRGFSTHYINKTKRFIDLLSERHISRNRAHPLIMANQKLFTEDTVALFDEVARLLQENLLPGE